MPRQRLEGDKMGFHDLFTGKKLSLSLRWHVAPSGEPAPGQHIKVPIDLHNHGKRFHASLIAPVIKHRSYAQSVTTLLKNLQICPAASRPTIASSSFSLRLLTACRSDTSSAMPITFFPVTPGTALSISKGVGLKLCAPSASPASRPIRTAFTGSGSSWFFLSSAKISAVW